MIPKEIRLTKNCDGFCDGHPDFGAKTDSIDTFVPCRINNLRVINTGLLHPAYRPARHFYGNCSLRAPCRHLLRGRAQSHEARYSRYFPVSGWSFAP